MKLEETCVDIDCPLKIYLDKLNKGVNCQYLLLQFLDKLFKYTISKFENNNINVIKLKEKNLYNNSFYNI